MKERIENCRYSKARSFGIEPMT